MAKAKKLDKNTIMFLRHYVYNLHADIETRANMREYLRINFLMSTTCILIQILEESSGNIDKYDHRYGSGYIGRIRDIKSKLIKEIHNIKRQQMTTILIQYYKTIIAL